MEKSKKEVEVYENIYKDARSYLLSFEEISETILDRHLNDWKDHKPGNMKDLLHRMLESICNRRGEAMRNVIGNIEQLRILLKGFNPLEVVNTYNSDYKLLFKTIKQNKKTYNLPGIMQLSNASSYWVQFCKSIISASRFLSRFNDLAEFNKFTENFMTNRSTRVGLPLILKEEIHGFGFALACDFLKANVSPQFVKPDTHIIDIFKGIHISRANASNFEVFTDVVNFSEYISNIPYRVDKLFWLVGSGKFYLEPLKVRTNKGDFIEMINRKYDDELDC